MQTTEAHYDATTKGHTCRIHYFSFGERQREFDKAVHETIVSLMELARDSLVPPSSVQGYSHGRGWIATHSNISDHEAAFVLHEASEIVHSADVLNHNVDKLVRFVFSIVEKMHGDFVHFMYKTVSDACDRAGQTINAKDYDSQAVAFLEAIKSIQFGVDKKGNVSRPTIHMHPQAFEKLQADIKKMGRPFEEEIEKVTAQKEEDALRREQERKSRFRTHS